MTQIINFDEILPVPTPTIIVDSVEHKMLEPTVESFLKTVKLLEAMGERPSPSDEMNTGIEIVMTSFPTLDRKTLNKWTLVKVQRLVDLVRDFGGETVTADAEQAASGNVQKTV